MGRSTPLATDVLVHLRRARDLIDARFGEPLDLATMASTAGFSRYHFAREFRAAFGEPPGSYLSRRRVERAKVLLVSANLTVTEVSVLVGFASLSSFIRRFAGLVGCSPAVYRRRMIEHGGPPPVPGCFVMNWGRPGTAIEDKPGPAGRS
ncbi:MAG: helix-turn-helix domain-containing protein [Labedaea sp.]